MKLIESSRVSHQYVDDSTGDVYVYYGSSLHKIGNINDNSSRGDGSGNVEVDDRSKKGKPEETSSEGTGEGGGEPTGKKPEEEGEDGEKSGEGVPKKLSDLGKIDEKELEKQDKEREEEIERELDELEDEDPYSEDAEARLEEIADILNDKSFADELFDETERAVRASRKEKREAEKSARKAAEKYEAKEGIDNFVLDLNKLIKTEIKKITKSDWAKYNKKADGTGLLKPGKSQRRNPSIPKLYVYFDQSGSWRQSDIEIGKQAISTLNTFVKQKKLVIELFYFGERLTTTPGYDANGPMWECFDKVAEHIKKFKPDNVVIMTDSDGDYYDHKTGINSMAPLYVKGGMFLLFRRGAVSKQVVRVFNGKKLNKIYKF